MPTEHDQIRCQQIDRIGKRSCKVASNFIMQYRITCDRRKKRFPAVSSTLAQHAF